MGQSGNGQARCKHCPVSDDGATKFRPVLGLRHQTFVFNCSFFRCRFRDQAATEDVAEAGQQGEGSHKQPTAVTGTGNINALHPELIL